MATAVKTKGGKRKAKSGKDPDPRVNEHGVYTKGVETVTVPLDKSCQSHAKIGLVELAGGRWKAVVADTGMDVGDFWNSGSPLTVRDKETFPSRAAAIGVMADRLIEMWTKQLKRTSGNMAARERTQGVLADLRAYCKKVTSPEALMEPTGNGAAKGKRNGPASPATRIPAKDLAGGLLRGQGRDLPIESIAPSTFNPRKDYPAAEIKDLAASIRTHGLLQPVVVRPLIKVTAGAKFELVAGERRWRAAKLAGLKSIPAVVRELTDREAREVCVIENLQRKDLNAIEEARGLQMLLGCEGLTQADLAARLGVSQPHVANRLRLLKLPAGWQKRIISGEIPPTHARYVLPYAEYPKLLAAIEKKWRRAGEDGTVTVDSFRELVHWTIMDEVQVLDGSRWTRGLHKSLKYFKPTDEQREQLRIIQIEDTAGKKVEVATNTKLWDKLQAEREKRAIERAEQNKPKGSSSKPLSAAAKAKLTPAKLKQAAEEEKRKAAERAGQFRRKLYDWKTDWMRYLIAGELEAVGTSVSSVTLEDLLRVFLMAATRWNSWADDYSVDLCRLLKDTCVKGSVNRNLLWAGLAELNDTAVANVAGDFAAVLFFDADKGPRKLVPDCDVQAIAKYLGIDLENAWLNEQAGGLLSLAYWNMHSKDQLIELSKELGGPLKLPPIPAKASKADAIKWFVEKIPAEDATEVGLPMPKEIAKAKRP